MNRNRTINSVVALRVVGIVLLVWGASSMKLLSQSLVRVVNVMRDAAEQRIDVYVDAEAVPRVGGLGYLEYSREEDVGIGTHTMVVVAAGEDRVNPIRTVSMELSGDSSYTVMLLGSQSEVRVLGRLTQEGIGNDSVEIRCAQVTKKEEKLYVAVSAPAGVPLRGITLPAWDQGSGRWGDSIGVWGEVRLLAGKMEVAFYTEGMSEQRAYSGHYREGSVVTFVVVGAYDGGSGDLGVYSIVETETGGGVLHRLREKGVGDGAVRPVSLAADLARYRFTIAGAPSGGSNTRYTFHPMFDDHLGSFNAKYMRYRVVGNQAEYDTLIDEDLYVGVDTLTTAILVGNQQVGYSVVSLQTPLLYQVAEGRSRLRVFDGSGSSDVGEIDVVFTFSDGSSERYNGLSFKGSTEYREVAYGPVVAELYRSGEQVAFARKRGYLPVDSQGTLMVIGPSLDSLGVALLVDTDSNYQSVKFWPDAGATGVTGEQGYQEGAVVLDVSPNPTSGDSQLTLYLSEAMSITVELHSLTGEKLPGLPQTQWYGSGKQSIPLQTDGVPSGMYLVRVVTPTTIKTTLLTIVR